MDTKLEIIYYIVAGRTPDKITECKVFMTFDDASDYFSVLEQRDLYQYIGMKKQGRKGELTSFQDVKSVRKL